MQVPEGSPVAAGASVPGGAPRIQTCTIWGPCDVPDELEIPEMVRGDLHEQINSQCTLRWKKKVLRKLHDENRHKDELINKL